MGIVDLGSLNLIGMTRWGTEVDTPRPDHSPLAKHHLITELLRASRVHLVPPP